MIDKRLRIDRPWRDYPIGTKAHSVTGGFWERVIEGWKWCTGATFPTPGGEACGKCIEMPATQQNKWTVTAYDSHPHMSLLRDGEVVGDITGDVDGIVDELLSEANAGAAVHGIRNPAAVRELVEAARALAETATECDGWESFPSAPIDAVFDAIAALDAEESR